MIQDRIAKGQSIWLSTALVASFAFYLIEVDENGKQIEIVDRMKEKLKILSRKLKKNPAAISIEQEVFGDVVEQKIFVETFSKIYEKLTQEGSVMTLNWLLAMK